MTKTEVLAQMAAKPDALLKEAHEALAEARRHAGEERFGLADEMRAQARALVAEAKAWREARDLVTQLDCEHGKDRA